MDTSRGSTGSPPRAPRGLSACALLLAACAGGETEDATEVTSSATSPQVAAMLANNGEELVFESISQTPPMDAQADKALGEAEPVVVAETGSIDAEVYQRYARPFAYAGEHEHLNFAAWQVPLADGTVERGVRVTSTSDGPAVDRRVPPATWVDPSLPLAANDPATAAEFKTVLIRIRDFPDWDIPLLPDAAMLDVQSYADALQARESALAAREAQFQSRATALQAHVEAAGGTVTRGLWYVGWIEASVPLNALSPLAALSDVQTIVSANMPGGTGSDRADWRPVEYMGVQPYWDAGQVGDEPNPNRHAWGGITIGTIDTGPVKDEAAAFCADWLCTSTKFAKRYRCDDQGFFGCAEVSNYPTSLENQNVEATNHATTVAAAAVADYLNGQGVLIGLTGTGPEGATSDARDARLIHYGPLGGFNGYTGDAVTSYTAALFFNWLDRTDIATSGTWIGGVCPLSASMPHDMVAENSFDDGLFMAILPGNTNGPSQSMCSVLEPASIPKIFTVNGLRPFGNGCEDDYRLCNLSTGMSSRGGASAKIAGVTYPNAVSVIDLAVPQRLTHFTRCGPNSGSSCLPRGEVVTSGDTELGTSFANPRLAGLAALAKDYFLDTNQSWFNNPGWLHTYMLGQGDSHRSLFPSDVNFDTFRATHNSDMFYGLGRVKMRHPNQFDVYGHDFRSRTFTTTAPYNYFVGNVPLHASTEVVKCVMAQHEDMSHKDDIAQVKLDVWLRPPFLGTCVSWLGDVGHRADTTRDTKHMVTFHGSEDQVGGQCAHVRITPLVLPTNGSVWTQTFCYAADEEEDAPN